jgi:hypothetical protein
VYGDSGFPGGWWGTPLKLVRAHMEALERVQAGLAIWQIKAAALASPVDEKNLGSRQEAIDELSAFADNRKTARELFIEKFGNV